MQVDGIERLKALKDQKKDIGRQAEVTKLEGTRARNAEADQLRNLKKTRGPDYDAAVDERAVAKGAVAEAQKDYQQTAQIVNPGSSPAAFQSAYTSKLLAKPASLLIPGKPNPGLDILTGGVGGLALGTEGAQKALAGQTGMQKRMAEALRNYKGTEKEEFWNNIIRGAGRGLITF